MKDVIIKVTLAENSAGYKIEPNLLGFLIRRALLWGESTKLGEAFSIWKVSIEKIQDTPKEEVPF